MPRVTITLTVKYRNQPDPIVIETTPKSLSPVAHRLIERTGVVVVDEHKLDMILVKEIHMKFSTDY